KPCDMGPASSSKSTGTTPGCSQWYPRPLNSRWPCVAGSAGRRRTLAFAQALHRTSSRSAKPLVSLNAGALAEGVFESELFGHVRGAFTDARADRVGRFELADGGTLFLDEIANVPLTLQPKLLRVLETGEFERVGSSKTRKVDVRLLSATNADLQAEVAQGRFRQDLLF